MWAQALCVTIEPAQRGNIKMIVTHADFVPVSVGIAAALSADGRAVFIIEGQAAEKNAPEDADLTGRAEDS